MCSQWYDKVINPVGGVVCGENDCFVLPLVFLGVSVGAVLAHLRQLETAQWLLFLKQVAQCRAHADKWRHGGKPFYDPGEVVTPGTVRRLAARQRREAASGDVIAEGRAGRADGPEWDICSGV